MSARAEIDISNAQRERARRSLRGMRNATGVLLLINVAAVGVMALGTNILVSIAIASVLGANSFVWTSMWRQTRRDLRALDDTITKQPNQGGHMS